MVHKLQLLFMILMIAVSSCKKDNSTSAADRPVVIGYLLAGHPVTVKVYQQKAFSDTAAYGPLIGGLQLQISNGAQTVSLTETKTGNYTYADPTFLQTGKTYTLQFTYISTSVSATTTIPAKTSGYTASRTQFARLLVATPDSLATTAVRFTWKNPDSLYHVLIFKNDNANTYASSGGNLPSNFSINVKKVEAYDVTYRQFRYSGFYSAILFTVNKEYSDILTTNTNTSSQNLTNPPGNIQNGYGIFTGMQADTIRLNVAN
jgi:hypothetical protein